MKRIVPFLFALTLCHAGTVRAQAAAPAFGKQPNIILIITDDQGYYDLSSHGNPHLATPNIDKLRGESLRFTRFQVSPTCAPTRSAIMSGRAPFYVGVTHTILERERMKLGVPTMPEMLRDAGYTTGIFGKWHLGDQDPYRPDQRGFDEVFIHGAGGIGQSYGGSCGDAPSNKYFDPAILHNNTFVKTQGFCTDIFFNQAMNWMETQKGKKPFFTYITTNAPHGPFIAPDSYKKKFVDAGIKGNTVGFYGMIENIDDNVGRLTAKLAEWGIEEDTLLIFITDNGPSASNYNGDHKGKKGSVDEGGTRVPSFWRWPGVLKPGADVNRIANHYDILPTFAAIAGGDAKQQDLLHGLSLVPLLKDAKAPWTDRFRVFHRGRWGKGQAELSRENGFAVRNQQFRLVGRNALYDMEKDPSQKTNVIENHPTIAKKMNAAYDKWYDGALPNMVNEDAPLTGHNTFHLIFWKQYGIEIPPVKQRKERPRKRKKTTTTDA
jgi:arylsulfatase